MFWKLQILIQETTSQGTNSCGRGLTLEERLGRHEAGSRPIWVYSISWRTRNGSKPTSDLVLVLFGLSFLEVLQMAQPLAPSRWHSLASLRASGGGRGQADHSLPGAPAAVSFPTVMSWQGRSQAQPRKTRRGTDGEAQPLTCTGWHLSEQRQTQAGTEACPQ